MTAALILTASSHTIACAHCDAPWPLAAAQCPGCGRREEAPVAAQVVAPSPDDLRAQLAAVTAERDALREAATKYLAAQDERREAQGEFALTEKGESAPAHRNVATWMRETLATEDAALAALRALLPTVPA